MKYKGYMRLWISRLKALSTGRSVTAIPDNAFSAVCLEDEAETADAVRSPAVFPTVCTMAVSRSIQRKRLIY